MTIGAIDTTVIAVYLVGITLVGILSSRKHASTSSGYFLAGRSLRWPLIGLALFATNISTLHVVGLASSAYSEGIVFGNFEWLAALHLILLGLVFAPFYFRTRISTLPEYLERRYSPASRVILACQAVAAALLVHISFSIYAGSKIIESLFHVDIRISVLVVAGLTVLYTVLGGLRAVVVTESIQAFLLVLGSVVVTVCGAMALSDRGITSWAAFTAAAQPHQLHMLRADGDFAWYAMLAGYPVIAIWYWCSDQTIVQRVLGARSEHDAQLGPVLAGFLKILPVFIMAVPGVMAYVLFGDELGSNRDMALSVMIDRLVPTGLKGLITAGLLAALMSTVASALNSTASVVSLDIVKRMRPHTSDRALLATGRVTACVVMALATAWSTQGDRFGGIFEGVNHSIIYLAPPITAVFLYGVFWARGTHEAALATLVVGLILGAVAFVLDFPAFGFGVIRSVAGIPFMLQGACLFVLCSVVYFTVSLRTPPPPEERIRDLCWKTPLAALAAERSAGLADPRLWASVLLAAIVALYVVFA